MLLQKQSDLGLHCLKKQSRSGSALFGMTFLQATIDVPQPLINDLWVSLFQNIDAVRGQKYFNIALALQDERLTIFIRPSNTWTYPRKVYAIKNIRE